MGTLTAKHIVALRAVIVILLAAISKGIAEECRNFLNNRLIIAEEKLIWTVNVNGQNREALATSAYPVSLDYDYTSNTLYWSDWETREIFALRDKSAKPRVAVSTEKHWLPSGLAVDSVTGKIYYAESFSATVQVTDLKNNYQAIVVGTNLTHTVDVEIDLDAGYLIVLDEYQIIRTDLDGSNRKVIYSERGTYDEVLNELPPLLKDIIKNSVKRDPEDPNTFTKAITIGDVVLDTKTKRVYWIDTVSRRIESVDYDGMGRSVHFQDSNAPEEFEGQSSLAFVDDTLYYANRKTKKVHKIDLNGNNHQVILENVVALAMKGIGCSKQQTIENPCENDNGGCQQLCLISKRERTNSKCTCNTGQQLSKDGKTCIPIEEFLLYIRNYKLRGQSLDTDQKSLVDVINPSKYDLGSYTKMDYDVKNGLVFYTSFYPNDKLHQIRLSTGEETIFEPDVLSKAVNEVAYDWVSKNLYYFTYYYADVTTLSVINVRNPTYSKVVIDFVRRLVRDIIVHPNRGYIFFAQTYDDRAIINRLATDGSNVTEIVSLDKVSIDSLAVDYENDRIYWIETREKSNGSWRSIIRNSNLEGKDVEIVPIPKGLKRADSLSVDGDYVYVVFGPSQKLVRLNKRQSDKAIVLSESKHSDITDVKVYSKRIQTTRVNHPCAFNHGCEKFCFAVPKTNGSLNGICGCPYGEKLAIDGKSCVDNSKEEPAFLPCQVTHFKCNMKKQTV